MRNTAKTIWESDDYARMKGGVEEGYGKVKGGTKALESEFERG